VLKQRTEERDLAREQERDAELLRAMFESTPIPLIMVSEDGTIVLVNNESTKHFGYDATELIGKPVDVLMPERFRSGHTANLHGVFAATVSSRLGAGRALFGLTKSGQEFPIEVGLGLVKSGNQRHELMAINNVTERNRAIDELKNHGERLEELVSARTSELEQSRDAAEAGNRAKTIFLDNMSHELRTPMNGVMGMIDLALRRATDPKQTDMLNKSRGAAQRMIKLVNDIIDFSKLEAERLPLEEKNFSLSHMIDDVAAMHDIIAEEKGLTLIREIPATFPDQLSGDAFRLRQILLNFLGNACKFSEQGMITVRVSAVEQDDDSLLARIEVEDQGIGINPEQQAMLFQAFTQADGSMTRKYGGAGLGLIISKRLANLMGGDVGMVSHEGHGSTFWATVRLKQAKAREVGT
jgi:PAS domain S-box-containing protein